MNFNLIEPNPGDKISANLIREIIRAIRSLTPINGHGMKISSGPNGTTYSADASKKVKPNTIRPWTFRRNVIHEGTDNEDITGGWYNGQIQFGLGFIGRQDGKLSFSFTGYDQTDDGDYYLEVKPTAEEFEIKRYEFAHVPPNDLANDTYYVYIGRVEDAVQTDGIYCVPVIYKYL